MKLYTHIFFAAAVMLFGTTTTFAQGVKITKADNTVIDIPASDLKSIEAYDAKTIAPYEGTWKIKNLTPSLDEINEAYFNSLTKMEYYPELNTEDEITIADGKLIPNLKSRLKNYFIGEATYEEAGTYSLRTGMFDATAELTLLKVKGVNRNFDPNSTSEDDEALIGIRMVEDMDADEPDIYFLEIYIIDYKSTSFAPEFVDFYMYADEKPVATNSSQYIVLTMEQAPTVTMHNPRRLSPYHPGDLSDFWIYTQKPYAIVLVGADWCGPYKLLRSSIASLMNDVNSSNLGYVDISLVNDSFSEDFSKYYKIMTLPTVLFMQNGNVYETMVGSSKAILDKVAEYILAAP